MSRYTCKKTHQITDVNKIVSVLPYFFFIFFLYTIESKQLTLLKSAFILCHYYFVVLLRVNEDWAVGMKHATVSSDVMRLVFKHRRRTKLVWNHLCMFENSNDTMLLFQCLQSFAFSNDINRVSYHSH